MTVGAAAAGAPAPASAKAAAPAPAPWAPPPPTGPPVPAGGAAQPLPALRESWQPVTISEPVTQPRSTRLGIVVLVVAIVVAAGLGVMHLRADPLPAGTSAFVAGGGVTYTSPDGAFQVQLPKAPTVDQRALDMSSQSVRVYFASADTNDYAMVVASIALPVAPQPGQVNAMLDDMMNGGLAQTNGTLVRKTVTMRGALPALEGQFTLPHDIKAHLLIVASGNAMVMLIVGARSGTDRLYKALETSLIIR
ncbi:MAG TPA: hypothetical protein VGP92_14940 [Acidimicrobiia bacterium]|nr:hypothetical protein [Acidimicrobiia bacterium]